MMTTQPEKSPLKPRTPPPLSALPLVDLLAPLGERGECRFDPELHSGPDAFTIEPTADRMAREDAAREVCESCPVWDSCLEYALRANPKAGIWAGLSAREIRALGKAVRELGEVA